MLKPLEVRRLLGCLLLIGLVGCSRSPEAKAARSLEKGKHEFQKKNYPAAALHFKNAITAKPQDAEPYYQLGITYLALNDVRSGVASLRKATDLNPNLMPAQLMLAELLASLGDKEAAQDAEQRALKVLSKQPDDVSALNALAVAELRLGKPESAETHLLQSLRKTPGHLRSSLALAQVRLARKDVSSAEQVLRQAADLNPKSPDPRVYLGGFFRSQGKMTEAEQEYRHALAIDPKHGPALLNLATLQEQLGLPDTAEQTYGKLSALEDKQYRPLHALFLFRTGKREQAIAELAKLSAADPADRNLRSELVAAYLAVNRPAEAENVLSAALKKNSIDADALIQRARIYLGSEKYTEAQTDLNKVLHYQSESAEAHYLLSLVSRGREQMSLQKQELGEALRLKPDYLPARIELVELLLKTGGAQSALKLLDEVPQEQKQNAAIVLARNWALIDLGRFEEARVEVDRVLAASPIPEVILQDASLKLAKKDYAGARTAVEKVLNADPGNIRALTALMKIYAAQKDAAAAVQKVREYAARQPKSAALQQFLGQLLMETGDKAGARQAFDAARSAGLKTLAPDLQLAQLDIAEGKRDDARKRLAELLAANPRNQQAHWLTAQVDIADGKITTAIDRYRKLLDMDPNNSNVMNNLAYLLADGNQADEALKYAQMAKQLAPEDPAVEDTLGWTYYQKGMYQLAVAHLRSATGRQNSARRQYHLAMAYLKSGDPQHGREALSQALKLDPSLPESQAARQAFGTR